MVGTQIDLCGGAGKFLHEDEEPTEMINSTSIRWVVVFVACAVFSEIPSRAQVVVMQAADSGSDLPATIARIRLSLRRVILPRGTVPGFIEKTSRRSVIQ
jgi:hypothetical protein